MDTIVDTIAALLGRLLDTFVYLSSTAPYSIIIKFAGAALVLYIVATIVSKLFRSGSGKQTNFSGSARSALRHGDYVAAADFYAYDGKLSKAYEFYIKGGAKRKAAEVALRLNNIDTAITLLIEAGDPSGAARIARSNNNLKKAGDIYRTLKSYTEAASAYEQAREYPQAAQMYELAEMFQPAADIYLRMNDTVRAAQCSLKAFNADFSIEKMEFDHEYTTRMIGSAQKTGALLLKVGMPEKAGKVYAAMKLYDLAAGASMTAGKFAEAGEFFTMANRPIDAAQAFDKAGDTVKANTVRAEHYRGTGHPLKAAECYERINEYMNAAELYASAESYPKAGQMYEKAGEYELAAQMYESANDMQHAASLYQRAGHLDKAKQIYQFVGDEKNLIGTLLKENKFIEAAEQYIKLGETDAAIQALQKVAQSDEKGYYTACVLLGGLFVDKGMSTQAIEKYRKAIGNKPLDRGTVDAYYGIATAMEATGEASKALLIYNKILAEDYTYKDTKKRIDRLGDLSQKIQQIKATEGTRYSIVKEIGRGNMGKVYEAYDNVLERKVAYKIPSLDLTHHPELVTDFLREAKSAAALNHPNIVIVYDAGKQGDEYYIAMELMSGQTLKDILLSKGRLSIPDALKVSEQLVRALVYAHSKNLIHRDIKPGNIMITEGGIVKLMDFGLAKIIHDTTQHMTKAIGTPYYMSPEQIRGDKINYETDIYAFGAVFYEMLTGTPPFSKGDVYYHHMHSPPPSLKDATPPLSSNGSARQVDRLEDIVKKCLQKEPERRFPSTADLLSTIVAARA